MVILWPCSLGGRGLLLQSAVAGGNFETAPAMRLGLDGLRPAENKE